MADVESNNEHVNYKFLGNFGLPVEVMNSYCYDQALSCKEVNLLYTSKQSHDVIMERINRDRFVRKVTEIYGRGKKK